MTIPAHDSVDFFMALPRPKLEVAEDGRIALGRVVDRHLDVVRAGAEIANPRTKTGAERQNRVAKSNRLARLRWSADASARSRALSSARCPVCGSARGSTTGGSNTGGGAIASLLKSQ